MKKYVFALLFAILLNFLAAPMALFIGGMATDAPGSGWKEFSIGFFFIQGIPLLILIICIVLFVLARKRID